MKQKKAAGLLALLLLGIGAAVLGKKKGEGDALESARAKKGCPACPVCPVCEPLTQTLK